MVKFPDERFATEVRDAIIVQAIEDWRILCRKRQQGNRYPVVRQEEVVVHFRELQRFFHETVREIMADRMEAYEPMLKMLYSIPGAPKTYMQYVILPEKTPETPWKGHKAAEGPGYAERAVSPLLEWQRAEMAARRAKTGL